MTDDGQPPILALVGGDARRLVLAMWIATIACGITGCSGGRSGRTGNLIANAGADDDVGSATGAQVPVPGWTSLGTATAVQYGVGVFPTGSDPGPPDRGANFFFGGRSAVSSLTQTIDVSAYSAAIDEGATTFELSGYLGGYLTQTDTSTVTLTFSSSSGADLGGALIGPVTPGERDDATALLLRTGSGSVPPGTRSVNVVMEMMRSGGFDNDGYADSLSLVLIGIR